MARPPLPPVPPEQGTRETYDLSRWGLREVPLFGFYDYIRAGSPLGRHEHTGALEVCLLAEGRQVFAVGGRHFVMYPDDVFLTFPGESHGSGRRPTERGSLYWVQVRLPEGASAGRRPFLGLAPAASAPLVRDLGRLSRRYFPGGAEARGHFAALLATCRELAAARGRGRATCELGARAALLLAAVIRASELDRGRAGARAMQAALEFIEEGLDSPLAVPDVAREVGLSRSRFQARFKADVGLPPGDYILRRKVDRAETLLAEGNAVTEVAHRLGFSSSQYFATVFRRYTGRRPRDARRSARGDSARG